MRTSTSSYTIGGLFGRDERRRGATVAEGCCVAWKSPRETRRRRISVIGPVPAALKAPVPSMRAPVGSARPTTDVAGGKSAEPDKPADDTAGQCAERYSSFREAMGLINPSTPARASGARFFDEYATSPVQVYRQQPRGRRCPYFPASEHKVTYRFTSLPRVLRKTQSRAGVAHDQCSQIKET
jgi:hypothetical protein